MRVALLSCNARAGNAIGNQVAEKLSFFQQRGADVRVFVESQDHLHPALRPHCQVMGAEPAGAAWEFISAADLVCVEFGQYYSLLTLLPLLAGKTRILIDYHGITPPELWGQHNRDALDRGVQYRGLTWCADRTLVHSRFMERELLEVAGLPPERLCRLGFPLDPEQFFPATDPQSSGRWRQELGLERASILLFVGRLAPNKCVPLLVQALERLRQVDPPVHLLVAGDTSDLYQAEAERCRTLAGEIGVSERLHFLGHLTGRALREAYWSADALVMPSRWESFCIPVIEAQACGLPVIAARAGALPETVADAGLTFIAGDGNDLVRQIRRVLTGEVRCPQRPIANRSPQRVAIVSFRYGSDFAGGAEWSLRRIAAALHAGGHAVEVFTTCNRAESQWSNELPAGTFQDNAITVHRFPIDAHNRERHLASVRTIREAGGNVPPEIEQTYLTHSIHSSALLDALRREEDHFDAMIAGPYLFGLTWDVAHSWPHKTLVLPCFHNEPFARLAIWRQTYERVAGILYHGVEEQDLAQADLGINHPGAVVIGTWMDMMPCPSAWGRLPACRSDSMAGWQPAPRYLGYCGRYSEQKNLPRLLDFAARYSEEYPGRFTFVFMGQGEVKIPRAAWAQDMGFASEADKRRLLAGADALVQLSDNESLSLVALEAWSLGTPVVASHGCAALAGHIERSGGGATVADFASFTRVLNEIWDKPHAWRERGMHGQEYVRKEYASLEDFQKRLEESLTCIATPMRKRLREQGLRRAAHFERSRRRAQFGRLVESLMDTGPIASHRQADVTPYQTRVAAPVQAREVLISVSVHNRGTHSLLADGPGRTVLRSKTIDDRGRQWGATLETPVPALIMPGRGRSAALAIAVPPESGTYKVVLWAGPADMGDDPRAAAAEIALEVGSSTAAPTSCYPLLETVQGALAAVNRCRQLPDDYLDVTEGVLARLKRWIKRKLLNNFRHAYVDVLSRQQSQVNQDMLTAVQHLTDVCASMEHALRLLQERVQQLERAGLDPTPERAPESQALSQ